MTNQQTILLPGFGDLLSRTWQIYKERFWVFLGIVILPTLIFLFFGVFYGILFGPQAKQFQPGLILLPILIIFVLVAIIILLWSRVALLYAIKDREEKIGIRESFIRGWPKIISYFWISLLAGFITLGGFLLFIIPGIIFSIWFAFPVYILVSENLKGMNALFKSKQLVEGYWWKVFWRFLVIGAIGLIIVLLFGLAISLINIPLLEDIAEIIFSLFFTPFVTTYGFLIYEDLRKIKAGIVFEPPKRGTKIKFILIGIIGLLLIPAILISIVLVSFGAARERAKEIRVIAEMEEIRARAEIIYLEAGKDYSGVSCSHPDLVSFCQEIEERLGEEPTIHSSQTAYCAYIKLPKGDYYCIDSGNRAGRTFLSPERSGDCDGITFICPIVYPIIPGPEGD